MVLPVRNRNRPRRAKLSPALVRGLRPGQVAQIRNTPVQQRRAKARHFRNINNDMRQRGPRISNGALFSGPPRPLAGTRRPVPRWTPPRPPRPSMYGTRRNPIYSGPPRPIRPVNPHANGPTSDNLDAFLPKHPPLNDSESRSTVVNGGYAKQITTSMATVIVLTEPLDRNKTLPQEFIEQAGATAGPVPEAFASLIANYPPLLVVLPMNGPVGYRLYTPVIVDSQHESNVVVGGIAYEDYGIEAFGTKEEYLALTTEDTSSREYADKFTGTIVESKPAKHSFRLRNTTPTMSQGGTVRQLRMTAGVDCPVWAGGSSLEVWGSDVVTKPEIKQTHPYYLKRYSMFVEALDYYKDLLATISASSAFRASSGCDFIKPRQGNTTASDAVYANSYEEQCAVDSTAKENMRKSYARGVRKVSTTINTAGSLVLERYVFRTALLAGSPAPSYDLTWTQEELRQNMLTGASFPYGSWPNFGNVGFTVDPLTLVGLELRYPASGGVDYVVTDVDPASPTNEGLIHMNLKDSTPQPSTATSGFTPTGDGWSNVDIPQLLLVNSSLLIGLRYIDNVTQETYIITDATATLVTSMPDGPSVQVNAGLQSIGEVTFDPMTATMQHPRFTPFCIVFDAVMTSMNAPFSVNSYELTIRGMQFARFTPGSLLGNAMRPQPANPTKLRAIRNKEEGKGSSLAQVVGEVVGTGLKAFVRSLL